ncbi:MAG: diguanylate cyclase [Suilimivivens sp.]
MKKEKSQKSLYIKLLQITLIPIFLLTLVITSFSVKSFATALNGEVKRGLMDLSSTILTLYDQLYPGDYRVIMQDDAIYMLKGEHQINGDFSIIDTIKENTGADITFFYQDTRVITTLYDKNGDRMIGTKVNVVVTNDVLEQGKAAFYSSVSIDGAEYFAYYVPLINDDGTCIGMLFVAKPVRTVGENLRKAILPIILLGTVAMIIAALFTIRFSGNLMYAITKIEEFLSKVAKGDLNESLDYRVSRREDELGKLGQNAVHMQKSLRELVEMDALTGLLNRRSGDKKLQQVYEEKDKSNTDFCIALGDIDFFKKVNDTFGHEWGDLVLTKIARIMKKNMTGKGFVSRWGGEEFLLIFRDCLLEEAVGILEGILNEVRALEIEYDAETKIRVTMTFGICQGSTDSINILLREADGKLYHGKNNGRNQIVQ